MPSAGNQNKILFLEQKETNSLKTEELKKHKYSFFVRKKKSFRNYGEKISKSIFFLHFFLLLI